jgi:hypothetical protein
MKCQAYFDAHTARTSLSPPSLIIPKAGCRVSQLIAPYRAGLAPPLSLPGQHERYFASVPAPTDCRRVYDQIKYGNLPRVLR